MRRLSSYLTGSWSWAFIMQRFDDRENQFENEQENTIDKYYRQVVLSLIELVTPKTPPLMVSLGCLPAQKYGASSKRADPCPSYFDLPQASGVATPF
jgi:hypothetical protein